MPEESMPVEDAFAIATAHIDQVQAMIDEGRIKFKDNPEFQRRLDIKQERLNLQKRKIKMMRYLKKIFDL